MNLVLIIGGAWLAVMIVVGIALSRAGRTLNPHVPMPEDPEDADSEPPPESGPDERAE